MKLMLLYNGQLAIFVNIFVSGICLGLIAAGAIIMVLFSVAWHAIAYMSVLAGSLLQDILGSCSGLLQTECSFCFTFLALESRAHQRKTMSERKRLH